MKFPEPERLKPFKVSTSGRVGYGWSWIITILFAAPFSCHYKGNWYRERQEFKEGPDDCSICLCVDTVVKCNDESCPRSTTTTSTTTTPAPTTPFYNGPRGELGNEGVRGDAGERGEPVRKKSQSRKHVFKLSFVGISWKSRSAWNTRVNTFLNSFSVSTILFSINKLDRPDHPQTWASTHNSSPSS